MLRGASTNSQELLLVNSLQDPILGSSSLGLSPGELSSSIGRFQIWVLPLHLPPHSQLEPKQSVVVQIASFLFMPCGLFTFANARLFPGKQPFCSRECVRGQPAQAPRTQVLILAVLLHGCCSFIYLYFSLSSKKDLSLLYTVGKVKN